MGLLRTLGRFLRSIIGIIVLVLVLLVAGVAYIGFTASGNQFLANRIAGLISTPDMQISLKGASGLLQGRFHLDRVTLADTKGKFAEVAGLDVFWTPSELFKARFHADRIAASKIAFDRLPEKTVETASSDSSASSFSLPVEIKVDSFDLPVIAIGKAIAKRDTVLSLDGSAQAVSDRIALDLNAAEKDRLNATAKATVIYAVNARTLELDSAVSEPQGGLLARLLALPGTPPVEIAVKGDGPLDNWKGSIGGRVDGKDVLQLAGSHRLAQTGVHEIALNGGGRISELLPEQLHSLFAGDTTVDIDARFTETGLIDIRKGSVANDSFTMVASGQLDPKGEAKLSGELRPVEDLIHVDLPLASGPIKADIAEATVTLNGAFRQATIDIGARLSGLATPDVAAGDIVVMAHSANLNLADRTGLLTFDLGAGTLGLNNPGAAKLVQGPVKVRGTLDFASDRITLIQSDLESARLGGKISGSFVPSSQQAAATFNLFLLPQGLLPPNIEAKISGTLGLSGQVAATLPASVSVTNLKLSSNLLTATGSASLDDGLVKADLAGDVANLGAFADKAEGKAHFTLAASGSLARPDITAQVTSPELGLAGKSAQAIDLLFKGALDLKRPGGHLTASATYMGQPIKTEADVALDNGLVSVPSLKLDIGANNVSGGLALNAALLPSGKLAFDFPDIAVLAKLGGQVADGALKGSIDVASADGRIAGTVAISGPRLSSAGAEITNPKVDLRIADLLTQQLSGRITAEKVASGARALEQVALDIGVAGRQVGFNLASRFDAAPLGAKGEIIQQDDELTIRLASFSAAPRQVNVRLAAPADIVIKDARAQFQKLTITAGEGSLVLDGTAGKTLDLTAGITDLPIALANAFADNLDAAGHVSANATITGEASAPAIEFDATIAGLATRQTRTAKLPDLTIAAKGRFADNALSLMAQSDLRGQPAMVAAQIKLDNGAVAMPSFNASVGDSTLSGSLALDRQSQPSGRIVFDVPDANALASIVGSKAEGAVKGTIDLASNAGKISAKLNASGMIRQQAISAKVEATYANGSLAMPALALDIGRNMLSGAVTLDSQFLPSGKVSFDFPDVALLAAMAGQQAEGSIKGVTDITSADGKVDAKVTAEGTIGGQPINLQTNLVADHGALSVPSLDARIGPNTVTGAVTLDARFMPSGQISFDLPDVAMLATIVGQKAEGAIKGTAEIASSGNRIDTNVSATGTVREQAINVRTNIISDNGAISLPSLKADIGPNTLTGTLTLDKSFLPSGQFSFDLPDIGLIAAIAGQQAEGALKGSATLHAANGKISGAIDASGETVKAAATQIVRPVIDLTITDLAAGQLSGHITADQIATGGNRLDQLALNVALVERQTQFDLTGRFDNAPLGAKAMLAPEGDGLKFTLSSFSAAPRKIAITLAKPTDILIKDGTASLADLSIKAGEGMISVSGTAGKTLNVTATIDALPLSLGNALSPDLDASGAISGDVRVTGNAAAPVVTFSTRLQDIATSQTRGAKLPNLTATANGRFADNLLSVTADTDLRGQPVKATAEVRLDQGMVTIPTFRADVGKSKVSGTIAFDQTFQPSGKITFDIPDANALASIVGQTAEGALKGSTAITSSAGRIAVKVDADGTVRKQAIKALADISLEKGAVSLPSLKLDVGRNTLSGAVTLDQALMPSGKLSFDFPDVALLAAIAGQKAEGAIKGAADIRSENGKVSGTIAADGTKLTVGGAEIVKPMANLAIADLATGQISGQVTADRIASGANALAKLTLDFARADNKTAFDLKSQYDAAPLTAKGAIKQDADGITVSLDAFTAAPRKIPIRLNTPTAIRLRNGAVALSSLSISAGKGVITVTGSAGDKLDLAVKVTALPADLANAVSPGLDAAGTISANATIKGAAAAPVVAFDTSWQNAAIRQTRTAGLTTFSVTAKGQLARSVLSINANARGGEGLAFNAGGTVGMTGNRALNIKVNGQLPFAALASVFATQGIDLKGNARFDLSVAGAATSPSISGRITTSGTTLTVIRQNLTVKDIAATVNLNGKQAEISRLTGNLSGGGTVSVSGTVGITPESGFPANIKIALKNAVYTDGKVVAAKLSGDLGLTGSLMRSPLLNGTIRLRRADITIPQKLPGTLAQIDIKHEHAPRAVIIQSQEIKESRPGAKNSKDTSGLALDLKIIAPRQIFVRGRGLDAELGGQVTLTGLSSAPNAAGGFKMLRGRLSIVGRRLDFTEGQISFAGDLTPALNLTASSTVEATTISVIVSGLANDPSVSFTSSPALPQDEVLALLIFGRNSAELSPVQIAQLADAVSTLAGGQSNSLFNKLRQGLGVDDLDVGTDENGKSNVSVGKYINKRTYLQLQQGVDNNSTSKAAINLDIGKGVKLRGEAGSDGSTAGGVFFEKEY